MTGKIKEIFRDVYNMAAGYTEHEAYWKNAGDVIKKYTKPTEKVLIIDMLRSVENYILVERQAND